MRLRRTPSQTAGPYLSIGLAWHDGDAVVQDGSPDAFWIRGRLLDGAGNPVPDGAIETWQPDPDGRFPSLADASTTFRGFGRSLTDPSGAWGIRTVKPGRIPGIDGHPQAPHLDVSILARGLLVRLVTRIYFEDEAEANAVDPVLVTVPAARRSTLVARRTVDGYTFDIHLQGDRETVFFDV